MHDCKSFVCAPAEGVRNKGLVLPLPLTPLFDRELKKLKPRKTKFWKSWGNEMISRHAYTNSKMSLYVWVQAPIKDACVKAIVAKFFATCKRACLHFHFDTTWRFLFFSLANLSRQGNRVERESFSLWTKAERIKSPNMRHWVSVMRELFILCSSQESWESFSNASRVVLKWSATTNCSIVNVHDSWIRS